MSRRDSGILDVEVYRSCLISEHLEPQRKAQHVSSRSTAMLMGAIDALVGDESQPLHHFPSLNARVNARACFSRRQGQKKPSHSEGWRLVQPDGDLQRGGGLGALTL